MSFPKKLELTSFVFSNYIRSNYYLGGPFSRSTSYPGKVNLEKKAFSPKTCGSNVHIDPEPKYITHFFLNEGEANTLILVIQDLPQKVDWIFRRSQISTK